MYALAVRQADGRIKIHMGDDVHLSPNNGGFISLRQHGSSVGFPVGQIEDVANNSQFELLTNNQKKAIALGKVQAFVGDWEAARIRDHERKGVNATYSDVECRVVSKVLHELLDSLKPESDRPTLEAHIGNYRGS